MGKVCDGQSLDHLNPHKTSGVAAHAYKHNFDYWIPEDCWLASIVRMAGTISVRNPYSEGGFLNPFIEVSITLIPKPGKNITNKI